MKASMCSLSCLTEVKDAPRSDWPCRIENQIEARYSVADEPTSAVSLAIEMDQASPTRLPLSAIRDLP